MEHAPYDHSEQPAIQLKTRSEELNKLLDFNQCQERYNQIIHELSCIALEVWWRRENGNV